MRKKSGNLRRGGMNGMMMMMIEFPSRAFSLVYLSFPRKKKKEYYICGNKMPTRCNSDFYNIYIIKQQDATLAVLCLLTTTGMLYVFLHVTFWPWNSTRVDPKVSRLVPPSAQQLC